MSEPTADSTAPAFVPPARQQAPTLAQQSRILRAVADIAATADQHPGVTIIHNMLTDSVEYMSEQGLALLQTSLPALRAMGPAYFQTFFNPADAADYLPRLYELLSSSDPTYVVSYFQQVRLGGQTDYTWFLSTVRVLLRDVEPDCKPLLTITTACPLDPGHHLTHKVSRLLDEHKFLRQHAARFQQLTPREREVLRALVRGLSTAEVASQLFVSPQTVETHRRNLRQKLGVHHSFELLTYAQAFDLI